MDTGQRNDSFACFKFLVEIDGIFRGAFSECTGLNTDTDPIECYEDNINKIVHKFSGLGKFPIIKLKRGMIKDFELWKWQKTVLDGDTAKKSVSIVLVDEAQNQVLRWSFKKAWPLKLEGPQLNASGNEVAIETLEIAHEGLELESIIKK